MDKSSRPTIQVNSAFYPSAVC